MPQKQYVVRTIFLPNYFQAAGDMASQRRNAESIDRQALVNAMRRAEYADKAFESELNAFAEKGYELIETIRHPLESKNRYDLLITAIFARDVDE